jgi:membrane fusion protein, multidrug efflux system
MKNLRWMGALAIIVPLGFGGYAWWLHAQRYPTTSDAYIGTHVVRIASQVDGSVKELLVSDHARVQQGQLLLTLDSASFRIAVSRAQANELLAKQTRAAAQAAVEVARDRITEQESEHEDAVHNYERILKLLKHKSVDQSQADSAKYRVQETQASLESARSVLQQARAELDAADARTQVAAAELAEARLNLSHTRITAPVSGMLGKIHVQPGDVISAGQQLFPLVQNNPVWVDANYKETELARIKPGQTAIVNLDMYPGKTFHGRVASLSPASGVAFALLPAENATGNWVKVTQRFPVRVIITDPDPSGLLRIGASSTVRIDTSSHGDT